MAWRRDCPRGLERLRPDGNDNRPSFDRIRVGDPDHDRPTRSRIRGFYILDGQVAARPDRHTGGVVDWWRWTGARVLASAGSDGGEIHSRPVWSEPGARLYKTGDLVRRLADGTIEWSGPQLDQQVKIRGFRIELEEIESALAAHPAIREAVVLAREDEPGDKRLVAYLTMKEGETSKDSELRDLLWARLPEYMVPSAFVSLAALTADAERKGRSQGVAAARRPPIKSKRNRFNPERNTEGLVGDLATRSWT